MTARYLIFYPKCPTSPTHSDRLSEQIFRPNGRELQVLPVMELTYYAHSYRDDPLADADLSVLFQNGHIQRVKIRRLLSQWLDS